MGSVLRENGIPRNRYLLYGGLIILFFINYRLPTLNGYFNLVSPSMGVANVDFYAYYRGGQAYNRGNEPYSGTRDGQLYKYPPTMVPLYGMLAGLDYETARHVWLGTYLTIFFLVLAWLIWTSSHEDRLPTMYLVFAMLLISYPFAYLIRQGQIDLIVGSFNFASLIAYIKKRKNFSALLLAASTLIKLNPLFLLVTYGIFLRDWKYLLRFAAACGAMIVISFIFVDPDWYRAYVFEVLPAQTRSDPFIYNQTPLRIFAGNRYLPRLLTIIGMGALTLFAWWGGKHYQATLLKENAESSDSRIQYIIVAFYTINVAFTLLFSGLAWIMAYVWFILPVSALMPYLLRHGRWWMAGLASLAILGLNGVVMEGFVFNSMNMLGAIFLVICLGISLIKPSLAFIDRC